MNKSMILATLVAALFAVPVAVANWGSYGQSEPNTAYDTTSWMYKDAPTAGQVRVYFNAYTTEAAGNKGPSPNVAALGSRIEVMGVEQSYAVLGVWTDCNRDGYIGLAEGAFLEYPSELLLDNAACRPATGGNNNCWKVASPCPNWPATGYNNFRGTVTEFIPVMGPGARTGGEARIIRDPLAAVWADFGRPSDPASGGTCAITPFPRGTLQSTGGLFTYMDCRTAFAAGLQVLDTFNAVVDAAGDPAGLRFQDDDNGRSGALGQFETLGDRYDDPNRNSAPIVKAQDCDSAVLVPYAGTPVGGQTASEGLRSPSTEVNPDGTVAGTVNYTFESGPFPTRQVPGTRQSTSNCDASDDRGDDAYSLLNEGDFNSVSTENKHEADWNFFATLMTRGGAPLGLRNTGASGDAVDFGFTPADMAAGGLAFDRTEWEGVSGLTKLGPQTVANRGGLAADDLPEPAIDQGYWLTHYAYVGAATLATGANIPGSPSGSEYGAAQCGSFTSGIHNGWNCDVSTWNKNPDGSGLPTDRNIFAIPKMKYNLRDVDCYDGSLGVGVGAQPAFYGERNCDTN